MRNVNKNIKMKNITFILLLFICNIQLYFGFNFKKILSFIYGKKNIIDLSLNLVYNNDNNIENRHITGYKTDESLPMLIINTSNQTENVKDYIENELAKNFNGPLKISKIIPVWNKIDVVSFLNNKHNGSSICEKRKTSLLVNIVDQIEEKNGVFLYFEELNTKKRYKINNQDIRDKTDRSMAYPMKGMFMCINEDEAPYLIPYNDKINTFQGSKFKGEIKTIKVYGEKTRIFLYMGIQTQGRIEHMLVKLQPSELKPNYYRYNLASLFQAKSENATCTFEKMTNFNTYSVYCTTFQTKFFSLPSIIEYLLLSFPIATLLGEIGRAIGAKNLENYIKEMKLEGVELSSIMKSFPEEAGKQIAEKYTMPIGNDVVVFSPKYIATGVLNGLHNQVFNMKNSIIREIKKSSSVPLILSAVFFIPLIVHKVVKLRMIKACYKRLLPYFSQFYNETRQQQSIAVVDFTNYSD